MPRPIRLFVSSSPDLAPEREIVGQAVAALPVDVGWEIKHTIGPGQDDREALTFVERCHFHLLLLGGDFAAPMGVELLKAQRQRIRVLAFRKDVPYSPAARRLLRRLDVLWTTFETPLELRREVSQALAIAILERGEHFGLHVDEILALLEITDSHEEKETAGEMERRRGAGRGAVILGRGAE
jgi:hypothetical protein